MAAESFDAEEKAHQLTELELLDRTKVDVMKASLESQLKQTNSYDSRNNLALLRLYQFYPVLTEREVVENVLMKALTNLPEPCFQHALCLLPPAIQTKPTIAFLIKLERLLQTGQFKAFWEHRSAPEVDDARAMLERVAGFDDHVRRFIVTALTITYQRISVDQMKLALNLSDVRDLCAECNWTLEEDTVLFPENKENAPQARDFSSKISLEDMAGVIRTLTK